jgi:hypothetical protein
MSVLARFIMDGFKIREKMPALTGKDLDDLKFVVQYADMIGLSEAQNVDTPQEKVEYIRTALLIH